jgi:hypothetical protein
MTVGASFEAHPFGTLLRMRKSLCGTKKDPHAEEAARRPSRSMHDADPAIPSHMNFCQPAVSMEDSWKNLFLEI